jgi:flagellar L-ring protein FlgH
VRGIVRRDDVQPTNVVLSTAISHLEVTLIGKGVISDGTRQPNIVVRTLLRILNF